MGANIKTSQVIFPLTTNNKRATSYEKYTNILKHRHSNLKEFKSQQDTITKFL